MSGVSKDLGPTPSGHVGGAVQSDDLMLAEQLDGTVIETVAGLVDKLETNPKEVLVFADLEDHAVMDGISTTP